MSWVLLNQLPIVTSGIGGAVCLIGVVIATARVRRRRSADRVRQSQRPDGQAVDAEARGEALA